VGGGQVTARGLLDKLLTERSIHTQGFIGPPQISKWYT